MRKLMPDYISANYQQNKHKGSLDAVVFFADISGFTKLTDRLSQKGRIGAEIISTAINCYFTICIEAVETRNGFVSHFTGDAFTAIFPYNQTTHESVLCSAKQAATNILGYFQNNGEYQTLNEKFTVSVKIGFSAGEVFWQILTAKGQNAYFFYGQPLMSASECEKECLPNSIVYDPELDSKINLNRGSSSVSLNLAKRLSVQKNQHKFYPAAISNQSQIGEYRKFVSCFIYFKTENLQDPPAATRFNKFYARVVNLLTEHHGYLCRINFGDKGSFLLIFFGIPAASQNPVKDACSFALQVVAQKILDIHIGLSYGLGYAGFIGSANRCEFTGQSSKVNLAARLMCEAGSNEIFTDREIAGILSEDFIFEVKGSRVLKGFQHPVECFQLKKIKPNLENEHHYIERKSDELKLSRLLQESNKNKKHRLIIVTGECGCGKTELINRVINPLPFASIIQISCNPCSLPFSAILQIFSTLFQLPEECSERFFNSAFSQFIKNHNQLQGLIAYKMIIRGFLAIGKADSSFSRLSFIEQQEMLFYALLTIFNGVSKKFNCLFFIDDAHYLDFESYQLINRYLECTKSAKVQFILAGRTIEHEQLLSAHSACRLKLKNLNLITSRQLIELELNLIISPKESLRNPIFSQIFITSSGNPLYIKAICAAIKTEFKNYPNPQIQHILDKVLADSLENCLLEQYDTMPVTAKAILRSASVLGLIFYIRVIRNRFKNKISRNQINDLFTKHRICSKLDSIIGRFNSDLFRDAIYKSILQQDLTKEHLRAAGDILHMFKPAGKFYSEVASHYKLAENLHQSLCFTIKAAESYKEQALYLKGALMYFQAVEISKNMTGSVMQTFELQLKAALEFQECGKYNQADAIYREIHNSLPSDIKPDKLAEFYKDYALLLFKTSDFTTSIEQLEKAEKALPESPEKSNQLLMSYIFHIRGMVYGKLGNFALQAENLNKSLLIRRELLSENDRLTGESYAVLGYMHGDLGEHSKQLKYYQQAVWIFNRVFDLKHPYIAMMHNNIGFCLGEMNRYKSQLKHYRKALKLRINLFGEIHPDTATSYNSLCFCLLKLGLFQESLLAGKKGLAIRKQLLEPDNPVLGTSYLNLANIYCDINELDKSEKNLKKAVGIFKQKLSQSHPFMALAAEIYGRIELLKENYPKAAKHFNIAISISQKNQNNTKICTCYFYAAISAARMRDIDRAKALYSAGKSLNKSYRYKSGLLVAKQAQSAIKETAGK